MTKRTGALFIAGLLALAGCQGDKGDTGPQGDQGTPGEPGVSTGTITGTLQVAGGAPVPGASVTTSPLGLVGVTAADGTFSIVNVPLGTYTLTVSGPGVTSATYTGVVVVAQTASDIGVKTLTYSPIAISFGIVPSPAGFGKAVALDATVTGATGALIYTWSVVSGPTAGAFSDAAVEDPTFSTGTLAEVIAGGAVKFLAIPNRPGLLNVTSQQQTYATYTLKLSVSDGSYSQSKTLAISPAGWVTGSANVGVGTMVIGNDAAGGAYAWTLTAPAGSTATLEAADTRNPWFIADVAGDYTLANGATSIAVKADAFAGATPDCGLCHPAATDTKVAGIWAEYESSAHANFFFLDPLATPKGIFAAGIDGEASAYYSMSCVKCHTTGYDPTAQNGGFDEQGFTMPATLQPGNFAALTAEQQQLGVIGCESCHGPVASHDSLPNAPKAFFNAEACGYCHDALTHHDRYQLWSQSKHANLETARAENRSTCTRCHSAQGFAKWTATGDLVSTGFSISLTDAEVQPQTCQACHDPHTTRLRIDGSRPTTLPAGFTVSGGGAGQLCMSCHNTRNGAKSDAVAPTSFQAPHVAAQADVFNGKNAYYVSGMNLSRHASVAETCVGCHMSKAGATPDLFLQPYTSNHSFTVGPQICGECHGEEVNGEATRMAVETALERVAGLGASYMLAKLNATPFSAIFVDMATDKSSSEWTGTAYATVSVAVDPATNPVTAVEVAEGHGQLAAIVTFTNDITFDVPAAAGGGALDSVTGKTFEFQLGNAFTGATKTTPKLFEIVPANPNYDAANIELVKALWNYLLVHGDGSGGIHNPSFVFDVVWGAEQALLAIQP